MSILAILAAGLTLMNTKSNTLILDAKEGREAKIAYYGTRLEAGEKDAPRVADYNITTLYPAFGLNGEEEPAISVIQHDGNLTLQLKVVGTERSAWEGGEIVRVTSADPVYDIQVCNVFKSFVDQDIIETWAEISNAGRKSATLTRYYSAHLPVRYGDVWISTLGGAWLREASVCEEPLTRGIKVIKNMDGVRNSHTSHAEAMISLDGKPQENFGRVIGMALEWGGNFELRFQTTESDMHHIFAGICPDNAPYTLGKGETLVTPPLALSYSNEGIGGVSRNFHRWGRTWKLAHGDKERKILLNSWEGVFMDINEPCMDQMMGDIAEMGGELFVMDDGWFGDKYPRTNDSRGLGDWVVDRNKLPNGIANLVSKADGHGIKFGIWIEPEMTNKDSELYEKHPDWVLKADGRKEVYGRGGTQLVLDLSNPEVQDFVFKVVDDIMTENPAIDYIKWDANMNMSAYGSQTLKPQAHLDIEYWHGFAKVCDRIRAKYPDVTMQACASGGGRTNWGVLPWFDEFWTSDNTDAYQRITLQWGTSYFFPAIAMASHISARHNGATNREISLKFRCDVAMSGRMGMELQPKTMTAEEKEFCKGVIASYKEIRPVVQFGDQYRLVAPFEHKGFASLMYVSEAKDKAVFYWWRLNNSTDALLARSRFAGLDPDKMYKVTELNRIDNRTLSYEGRKFSGRFLMENGLEIPYSHAVDHGWEEWSSRVLYLVAE